MKTLICLEDALDIAMQYCPDDDGSCSKAGVDIREMLDKLEALPSAEPEPQWIPCAERLPEDGLYLVTTSKGQVQAHVFSHNGNSKEYWMRCNKAWMPLPEPYAERRNDD